MSNTVETARKPINGVDAVALHDVIKAVRTQPKLGASKFSVTNRWLGGGLNRSTVGEFYAAGETRKHSRKFEFDCDEPAVLLGEDRGANPVEFVLHALAGCVSTTTVYHAAANGIRIRSLETTLEGELDLQGLLQTDPSVQTGYKNIRVRMKIDSDADGDKLEKLKNFYRLSPVFGTLTQSPKVDVSVDAVRS